MGPSVQKLSPIILLRPTLMYHIVTLLTALVQDWTGLCASLSVLGRWASSLRDFNQSIRVPLTSILVTDANHVVQKHFFPSF